MRGIVFLCLLPFAGLYGQEFTTTIRPEKVEVGEVFTILFETEGKTNLKLSSQLPTYFLRPNPKADHPDTIRLEMVEKFGDSVLQIQGKSYYQILGKALCFDTGLFLFAPSIEDKENLTFDAAICRVDFTPNSEQAPIKDIEEVFTEIPEAPFDLLTFLWENLLWIVGVLAIGFITFIWLRRRKEEDPLTASGLTLKEQFLKQLDDLCRQRLWEKQNLEAHFVPVVDVLRNYLSKEYGYQFQHKTTFEILLILNKEGISENSKKELSLFLEVGDLIKFAQSSMQEDGIDRINLRIRNFLIDFER